MISNPCAFAIKYSLWDLYCEPQITISNKEKLVPHEYKTEPEWTLSGWYRGYSFKHFWSNCFSLLGEIANIDGIQQLCHQYYLQNGSLGAKITVDRIRKLID